MPVELLQRVDDIIPDLSVVCGARCFWGVTWDIRLCDRSQYSPGLGIRILERWEFGSLGSRSFRASFALTNDETSSVDSSRNDRGSGGGRRALARTTAISSTQGRVTHPGVNRQTKRILCFVAVRDGWVCYRPGAGRACSFELSNLWLVSIAGPSPRWTWRPRDPPPSVCRPSGGNKKARAYIN